MKKFILVLICFLSWSASFASGLLPGGYDVTKLPKPLPYTYGGVTYHHVIAWPHTDPNDHWVAYYNTALTQDGSYLILTENDACFYQLEPNGPVSGNPNAWCGAVSILVNECTKTYFSDVDIVATSSGTLYGSGNCSTINYSANDTLIAAATFLSFPIPYDLDGNPYTAYTAPVSSVMDQSTLGSGAIYSADTDGQVTSSEGETGNQGPYPGTTCYSKSDSTVFGSSINYVRTSASGGRYYLCYNGHPGYDYSFSSGTHIVVPESGTLCAATANTQSYGTGTVWRDVTKCPFSALAGSTTWDMYGHEYHAFYIVHSGLNINGSTADYITGFLHSNNLESSIQSSIEQNGYSTVTKGQFVAQVGGWGPSGANTYGYHLHFETYKKDASTGNWNRVDPYGDGTNDVLWR